MTRPAAPNTSPSDDDEVACAGVWVTGNGDACDQDRDDLYTLISWARGVLPEVHKNTPPVLPTLLGDNNIEHVRLSNKPSARALRSSGFPYLEARTNSATLAFPHLDRNHPFPKHSADNHLSLFLVVISASRSSCCKNS
ncbi:hypothetical protein KEM48_010187 [Puccinia striiformis f. sp. tritici PST-130]|nr:hypothetical protein KEM48_010187 [Puccinia striiformis f. sp. tritici PST-130]